MDNRKTATKTYLQTYNDNRQRIEYMQREIDFVRDYMARYGMPITKDIQSYLDLFTLRIYDDSQANQQIETNIDELPEVEQQIIKLRYIDGAAWQQIEAAIHYSHTQTHSRHQRALDLLNEIINNKDK